MGCSLTSGEARTRWSAGSRTISVDRSENVQSAPITPVPDDTSAARQTSTARWWSAGVSSGTRSQLTVASGTMYRSGPKVRVGLSDQDRQDGEPVPNGARDAGTAGCADALVAGEAYALAEEELAPLAGGRTRCHLAGATVARAPCRTPGQRVSRRRLSTRPARTACRPPMPSRRTPHRRATDARDEPRFP